MPQMLHAWAPHSGGEHRHEQTLLPQWSHLLSSRATSCRGLSRGGCRFSHFHTESVVACTMSAGVAAGGRAPPNHVRRGRPRGSDRPICVCRAFGSDRELTLSGGPLKDGIFVRPPHPLSHFLHSIRRQELQERRHAVPSHQAQSSTAVHMWTWLDGALHMQAVMTMQLSQLKAWQ